jgi:predicted aconitase with swiveling domain
MDMESAKVYTVRVIKEGCAEGTAMVSTEPIGFLGGVDGTTGIVTEKGHPLEGQCVAGRVLVFPTGKGSTVGSYVLYQLGVNGLAPVAIINAESEPIVAVGAIISEIPMVDQMPIEGIQSGDHVRVDGDKVTVEKMHQDSSRVR